MSSHPDFRSLDRFPTGHPARIVQINGSRPHRLIRLSNMGLVPGVVVRVEHRRPTTVIVFGATTLALDPAIAAEIVVEPLDHGSARERIGLKRAKECRFEGSKPA